MENFNIDAYKPKEIADRIEQISISKSTSDPLRVFTLALLAGAFIAFAGFYFRNFMQRPGLFGCLVMLCLPYSDR